MSSLLAEHMTQVYRILPKTIRIRGQFRTDSERQLYNSLPGEFTKGEFNRIAKDIGLVPRTVERYLAAWGKDDILIRTKHGEYMKPQS